MHHLNANLRYKTTPKENVLEHGDDFKLWRIIILDFLSARISHFCLSSPVHCIFKQMD